jgi:sugar/nucleoside kinase (ribokinase family)
MPAPISSPTIKNCRAFFCFDYWEKNMGSILVVGSLAYDSIKTPIGSVRRTLGGSANYFSIAASLLGKVKVVGVVGEDYQENDVKLLEDRGVDLSGMVRAEGKTFHWEGCYEGDMNEVKTLKTDLNVFENFDPLLPDSYRNSEYVFLANIDPDLQMKVLEQVRGSLFIGSDTMNLWIDIKRESLLKLLRRVNLLLLNEGEAELLTGSVNGIQAALKILEMGPKFVVIKRGEYGFVMAGPDGFFMLPAVPVSDVVDPTGAGDSFAGGFYGYLAQENLREISFERLKWACIYGSVMASFTVQGFGLSSLVQVTQEVLQQRLQFFEKVTRHPV